jgi:hypothetical protein
MSKLRKSSWSKACGRKWQNKSGSRLYYSWRSMRARCRDGHKNYGARGIKVCRAWDESYDVFFHWAMGAGYRAGLTIDRIDNDKGYQPSNCRWITLQEQLNNQRRNVRIEHNGITRTIAEWCDLLSVPKTRVYKRWQAHGAKTYEELFCSHLLSFRHAKKKFKCKECGVTKSPKWRKSTCANCYGRALRKKYKDAGKLYVRKP